MEKQTKITTNKHLDILILGAGMTGLSTAHFLKDKDYLILEKEDSVGGMIRDVIYKEGKPEELIFSTSGHWLHFKNQNNKEFFESKVPITWKARNSKIYVNGEFIEQPFQFNFPFLKDRKLANKMLKEMVIASSQDDGNYKSFKEMLEKKYGKSACDSFFFPYNEKLYGELNNLDINSMGRFFPEVSVEDIFDNIVKGKQQATGYNTIMGHPSSKKFADILNALDFDKNRIKLSTNVLSIDLEAKCVETDYEKIYYNTLVTTIPFKSFLKLVGREEDSEKLKASSLKVFNAAINKSNTLWGYDWVYYPDKELPFFRVGSYSNFFNEDKGRLYIECPEHATEEEVKKGLISADIISNQNEIEELYPMYLSDSYNIISPESISLVQRLRESLKSNNVMMGGRYSEWTYYSVEDCFEVGRKIAKEIKNEK